MRPPEGRGRRDPDRTWARLRSQRWLRQHRSTDGAWRFSGCGTVDDAAQVNAALDDIVDELFAQARLEGREIVREQLAYDAVVEMARRYLTADPNTDASGATGVGKADATGEPVGPSDRSPGRSEERENPPPPQQASTWRRRRRTQQTGYLGLIRADLAALQRGVVEGEEICEIAGLGPIPVRRAKQLLGDAVLKLVLTKGTAVGSVVHLGRSPTVAQRTALAWLMPCCSVRGCSRSWVEYDHRQDWARTHQTRLAALDPLCPFHHDLKTRLGWALVTGTGKRPMVPPEDPRHPQHLTASTRPDDPTALSGPDTLLENFIDTNATVPAG